MANHQPRAQRLRQMRKARSAERELKSSLVQEALQRSQFSQDLLVQQAPKLTKGQMRLIGNTSRFDNKQREREQDHLKRNTRKNNPDHPHPKRKVHSPEELKRRNVLLSLPATKPETMSTELWKGLLKERKQLFTVSNPRTRGIPDYSAKVVPARRKPTRFQEVYKLGSVIAALDDAKAMKKCLDSGFGTNNIHRSPSGYRRILGVKRIPHFD